MQIKLNGTKEDISQMLLSAVRYALGRQTYIVNWTCEFVANNIDSLTEKIKQVMIRDIKEQERYSYGWECDKKDWLRLLEKLKESVNND